MPPPKDAKDDHPVWVQGTLAISLDSFHRACAANGIPRTAYTTVAGFYDRSLPALASTDAPVNLALVYIDCDLYSSTVTVLDFQTRNSRWEWVPYMRYGWHGNSFVLEDRSLVEK